MRLTFPIPFDATLSSLLENFLRAPMPVIGGTQHWTNYLMREEFESNRPWAAIQGVGDKRQRIYIPFNIWTRGQHRGCPFNKRSSFSFTL